MSQSQTKAFLSSQLLELDRLGQLSSGDPIMSAALKKRRESIQLEFAKTPPDVQAPRTVLFFAGEPVMGSRGIDAKFAADVIAPFVEMVKTQYSAQKHGRVGARGPRKDESEARLFLTGLPRGSFGLELSQPQSGDFIAAEELSDALVRLTEVIGSAADADERFAVSLDRVSPRVLPKLKDFLSVVSSNKAYLGIESGTLKIKLPAEQVTVAFERVGAAKTNERETDAIGTFRGATLDSWRFDFKRDTGELISGRIDDGVDETAVEAMNTLTNKPSRALIREIIITTRDGGERHRYELLGLAPV